MSRNGSGTYSVVNTFVSNTTITASDHNENWSDLATELTNSVAADGQTSMTGALKAANGSVSAPGITFASDTDTGIYRIDANNVGVAVNGTKIIDVATTGATVTGTFNATGTVKQGGVSIRVIGEVIDYAGASAPSGWILCHGGVLSQTTYADLFAVIGTTYNTGSEGAGNFRLPDCRDRVSVGKGDMGGSAAARISSTHFGGSSTATLGATGGDDGMSLAQANLPNVNFSSASLSVSGTVTHPNDVRDTFALVTVAAGSDFTNVIRAGLTSSHTFSGTISGSVPSGGSGTEISRVQPGIIFNKIIYHGVFS